ncbi:LLM class flavin-dependent oxidoreductase [Streptomyces yaizuensis]|uniref:LLM class flavin-dependent oxidoreductase n=1 Tax=Streptomyces yaizuensis TaxID=2989713 RepID=A0ABQ5P0M6_9ACTN|nr:LLM class flavin-dependent oxidoreductase [Streptomyces sp. YSPA8]GLF96162.1 LLM class flavin-dependent oxidoreductase [Streptomyces sp. YSPA8]
MAPIRPLHLAVALDGPARFDAAHYAGLVALAEHGALDFVTLGDPYTRPGPEALSVLSRIAPLTRRIGLVPTVTTTHTDPHRLAAALATLDWVSQGRAGWAVGVSATEAGARLYGHHAAPAPERWRDAERTVRVVTDVWDGRTDVWDGRTGGAVDGAGADGAGSPGRVPGPRTGRAAPRPPQGRPPVVVDLTGAREPGRRLAARHADVVLIRARTPDEAAERRATVLREARELGRDPAALRVLLSLSVDLGGGEPRPGSLDPRRSAARAAHFSGGPVELAELIARWHRDGAVDGCHLVPLDPHRDLERVVNGTVALLQHRSLFRSFLPGGTLREHLGLPRPARGRAPVAAGTAR